MDKFGLRPWEIAKLTDRIIRRVYFHARDENGSLVAPSRATDKSEFGTRYDPPATLEDELKTLADLQAMLLSQSGGKGKGITNYATALEQIRAKWADGSRQRVRAEWEAEQAKKVTDGK